MPSKSKAFTFIDLFAGIGGFRIALEKVGGHCLGFSEIDKQAIQTYKNNFDTKNELEFGDITKIKKLPYCDVLVGGVPCQAWSVAGKMRGFDDERGKLWFDTIRLLKTSKPKVFIFENVKGLLDPRNHESLNFLLTGFKKVGYNVSYSLLNAYDFGLPQNRDRVILVGFRKDLNRKDFSFPVPTQRGHRLEQFVEGIDTKTLQKQIVKFSEEELFQGKVPVSRNRFQKSDELNDFFTFCDTRNGHTTIHSWDLCETTTQEQEICLTILKERRKSKYGTQDGNPLSLKDIQAILPEVENSDLEGLVEKNILRKVKNKYEFVNSKNSSGINGIYRVFLPESQIFSTLTATGTKDMVALRSIPREVPEKYKKSFIELIYKKGLYRPLNSREAARLQGFPETYKYHSNEKFAMKQFGNAVPVHVIASVMQRILKTGVLQKKSEPVIRDQDQQELFV